MVLFMVFVIIWVHFLLMDFISIFTWHILMSLSLVWINNWWHKLMWLNIVYRLKLILGWIHQREPFLQVVGDTK